MALFPEDYANRQGQVDERSIRVDIHSSSIAISATLSAPITGNVGITAPITGNVGITAPITGNVGITAPITMLLGNGTQLDAFSRLRVSTSTALLSEKFLADNKAGIWDEQLSNATATWTTGSYITLTLTSGSGYAVRQTYQRADYEPGKGQKIMFSAVMQPEANTVKRAGWAVANTSAPYVPNDGIYFKAASGSMQIVKCTDGVETTIAQTSWNIDRMDGSGNQSTNPSGINVDWTKGQIFFFDLQWLSFGRIRFGLEIGGRPYLVHEIKYVNELTAPYMSIPNLPIYCSIHGEGATGTMRQICAVVESEGGRDDIGHPFSFDTLSELIGGNPAGSPVSFNDSLLHALLVMRLRAGRSHAIVFPHELDIFCNSTSAFRWVLVRNPTIAGTALSYIQASDSVEIAKCVADNTVTIPFNTNKAAVQILSGYTSANVSVVNPSFGDFHIGVGINGTSETLVVCAQRLSAQSETFYATIDWVEIE